MPGSVILDTLRESWLACRLTSPYTHLPPGVRDSLSKMIGSRRAAVVCLPATQGGA